MPRQSSGKSVDSSEESAGPPPLASTPDELSVESGGDKIDGLMTPIPLALLVLMSAAAVTVLVGMIVPRMVIFLVPAFTVCGFWVAAKGLKMVLSAGIQRLTSPFAFYGLQLTGIGCSGILLIFFGLPFIIGFMSESDRDFRCRFLLFLFSIVFFPIAVYLRNRAIKHLGGN